MPNSEQQIAIPQNAIAFTRANLMNVALAEALAREAPGVAQRRQRIWAIGD